MQWEAKAEGEEEVAKEDPNLAHPFSSCLLPIEKTLSLCQQDVSIVGENSSLERWGRLLDTWCNGMTWVE